MRLKRIKMAGFKSFVDPTVLPFPGNRVGIVGPNGCGKSNTIDAIRWVMGESSAKQLRGGSLSDVIFNGSDQRKPVGQASVELLFDNHQGKLGGEYAHFSELAIRRLVSRDGQSVFSINGTRCRKRDIVDIFLGTGLGPGSYAVIEQGMVSRLIEARPEDLRSFIEEAAGISKYRERRRETEQRIRHTNENLERLEDILQELSSQVRKLEKQAEQAKRYKMWQLDEQQCQFELSALRWQQYQKQYDEHNTALEKALTAREKQRAEVRSEETHIEQYRIEQQEAAEQLQAWQGQVYEVNAQLASVEQTLTTNRSGIRNLDKQLSQMQHHEQESRHHLERDQQRLESLAEALSAKEPALVHLIKDNGLAEQAVASDEKRLTACQQSFDARRQDMTNDQQKLSVLKTKHEHVRQQQKRLEQELLRVLQQQQPLETVPLEAEARSLDKELAELTAQLGAVEGEPQRFRQLATKQRQVLEQDQQTLNALRKSLSSDQGKREALQLLVDVALGRQHQNVAGWLQQHALTACDRLASTLTVESGWEKALEMVLSRTLDGVCVEENLADLAESACLLDKNHLCLLEVPQQVVVPSQSSSELPTLLSKVQGEWVGGLLQGVFITETLEQALLARPHLALGESIVTRDAVWLGVHWLYVLREHDESLLQREQKIRDLDQRVQASLDEEKQRLDDMTQGRKLVEESQSQAEDLQQQWNQLYRQHSETESKLKQVRQKLSHTKARMEQFAVDTERLQNEQESRHQESRDLAAQVEIQSEAVLLSKKRCDEKSEERTLLEKACQQKRQQHQSLQQQVHRETTVIETQKAEYQATVKSMDRLQTQHKGQEQQQQVLRQQKVALEEPLDELEQRRDQQLTAKAESEALLTRYRQQVDEIDFKLRSALQTHQNLGNRLQASEDVVESLGLKRQESSIHAQTLETQLEEQGVNDVWALVDQLPSEANEVSWKKRHQKIQQDIRSLGAVNLAAADELREKTERQSFLQSQQEDLSTALEILQQAIAKMDQQTRSRFQETFERVNRELNRLFSELFNGGQASLRLEGDDWLTAGVHIIAQPPGKRNSHIQMLSGGEKALTAIALVFAFFSLNPAPFCILDEVDAPLDDTNVGRFCRLVKEISKDIQCIFITHNKITMELASQLLGVTMSEAGVSQMVSVDIDQAVEMGQA